MTDKYYSDSSDASYYAQDVSYTYDQTETSEVQAHTAEETSSEASSSSDTTDYQ